MYECMYAFMYVYMYICIYVYTCMLHAPYYFVSISHCLFADGQAAPERRGHTSWLAGSPDRTACRNCPGGGHIQCIHTTRYIHTYINVIHVSFVSSLIHSHAYMSKIVDSSPCSHHMSCRNWRPGTAVCSWSLSCPALTTLLCTPRRPPTSCTPSVSAIS